MNTLPIHVTGVQKPLSPLFLVYPQYPVQSGAASLNYFLQKAYSEHQSLTGDFLTIGSGFCPSGFCSVSPLQDSAGANSGLGYYSFRIINSGDGVLYTGNATGSGYRYLISTIPPKTNITGCSFVIEDTFKFTIYPIYTIQSGNCLSTFILQKFYSGTFTGAVTYVNSVNCTGLPIRDENAFANGTGFYSYRILNSGNGTLYSGISTGNYFQYHFTGATVMETPVINITAGYPIFEDDYKFLVYPEYPYQTGTCITKFILEKSYSDPYDSFASFSVVTITGCPTTPWRDELPFDNGDGFYAYRILNSGGIVYVGTSTGSIFIYEFRQ